MTEDQLRKALGPCNLHQVALDTDTSYMKLWRFVRKGFELDIDDQDRVAAYLKGLFNVG